MSSKTKKLGTSVATIQLKKKYEIAIVVSEYYFDEVTRSLSEAAISTLIDNSIPEKNISLYFVPGAFELIAGCQMVYDTVQPAAVLALGCVIKGDTDHDKYINHAVAQGLAQLSIQYKTPFLFGLLTPNTMKQAKERSGGKLGNKGIEVAMAAVKMLHLKEQLATSKKVK
jgi:6,7-dimethyl-8-ribityllumazine synthase